MPDITVDPTGPWGNSTSAPMFTRGCCAKCRRVAVTVSRRYGRGAALCDVCSPPVDDENARTRESRMVDGAAQLAGVLGGWR
jgi:hypothetical protein